MKDVCFKEHPLKIKLSISKKNSKLLLLSLKLFGLINFALNS